MEAARKLQLLLFAYFKMAACQVCSEFDAASMPTPSLMRHASYTQMRFTGHIGSHYKYSLKSRCYHSVALVLLKLMSIVYFKRGDEYFRRA